MDLTPAEALVRDADGERRVPSKLFAPGAVIVIKPGEKVPLDGKVVAGCSAVNQAPVTGESLPIDKGPGDEVFAGSINGRGALDVRVTRFRRDTTLARIIHLVEQAQAQRAPVADVRRAVRPRLYAGGHRARAGARGRSAAGLRCAVAHLDLSRPGAAGGLVPVRAGDLDAGVDRRRAGGRRAQRRADQGRRAPRTGRHGSAASRSTRPAR